MARAKDGHDFAVETFANHSEMGEREAEAFVYRELEGVRREQVAHLMEIEKSTVDSLVQRAKKKARLPAIDKVFRVNPANTGLHEGRAWEIWFENQSMIRYVWDTAGEEIREQTVCGNDTDSILNDVGVGGDREEVEAYALETIQEYTCDYQKDWGAAQEYWGTLFEALTGW